MIFFIRLFFMRIYSASGRTGALTMAYLSVLLQVRHLTSEKMYRQQRNYENLQKRIYEGTGVYDIPEIMPEKIDCTEWIPFSGAATCKSPETKGVHFFIDDYRFNRIWTNPDAYIDMLRKFRCVMTPDFSTYTDFPKAIQIYNHYRKHWCGAYLQENGIKVIPTISWSTSDSFDWCFDGEPTHCTVAISSVGVMQNKGKKKLFLDGYRAIFEKLEPTNIIFYGKVPPECTENIVRIKSYGESLHEALCAME